MACRLLPTRWPCRFVRLLWRSRACATSEVRRDAAMTTDHSYPVISSMLSSQGSGLYAVTGPAGSGKTCAAKSLASTHRCVVYSADFRFIGDSIERRRLLDYKQSRSLIDYRDSANQFNWWDWAAIDRDLTELAGGGSVLLAAPYERESGQRTGPKSLGPSRLILFEGAILGPPELVSKFTRIFFLHTPETLRLTRILEKDHGRRDFGEVLARFLITEYSETLYYRNLFSWASDKLVFVDALSGQPCSRPTLPDSHFLPVRVTS